MVSDTYKLTKELVPDDSLMLWVSDVHLGIENRAALQLMIDCAELEGVTHNLAMGDIFDCHAISTHDKNMDRMRAQSAVRDEVAGGQWFVDWLSTRWCGFVAGNHEGRIDRFVQKNPALYGLTIPEFLKLPDAWTKLPVGGRFRLGNLVMAHGDSEFQRSIGKYPAQKLLDMAPDQSTIVGHVHRISSARRTSVDEDEISRTRAGWTMGHMSLEEMHREYAGRHPNWQTGFGLIRVWWEGDRPRWNVYQIEVLFDRRGRPYFEFNGHVYR